MTSTQVPVPHPLDAEADDLPPAPVLLVATSDGKLRFYTAGHLRRPMQGVVRPPVPLPSAPALAPPSPDAPATADEPTSTAGPDRPASADEDWVRVEQAATVTALPSDGEDEDDGDVDDDEPGRHALPPSHGASPAPADEQLQKAAAAGLPPSSDEDNDGETESSSGDDEATSQPAASRMQMPPAQTMAQPAAEATGTVVNRASDGTQPLFGAGHRLSPAGAAAAARHAAASQSAVATGGGSTFGGAFSFATPAGQSSSGASGPTFALPKAFGATQPSGFGMPAFGQSTPVRPLFGAQQATTKAPATPATSAASLAAVSSKKVQLLGCDPGHCFPLIRSHHHIKLSLSARMLAGCHAACTQQTTGSAGAGSASQNLRRWQHHRCRKCPGIESEQRSKPTCGSMVPSSKHPGCYFGRQQQFYQHQGHSTGCVHLHTFGAHTDWLFGGHLMP